MMREFDMLLVKPDLQHCNLQTFRFLYDDQFLLLLLHFENIYENYCLLLISLDNLKQLLNRIFLYLFSLPTSILLSFRYPKSIHFISDFEREHGLFVPSDVVVLHLGGIIAKGKVLQ